MSKTLHLYEAACSLYLLLDGIKRSFYRRFEEFGNFGPRPESLIKAYRTARATHPVSFS